MDCSLPGSSIHGILQARILEWYAPPFSRGSSQPRDQTHVLWITGRFFTSEPPGKSSYQWGRFLSAPLDRRELRSPRSSQPLRVLFVFSTQVSDSACLAVPTTYSFLEENLVFIEIRKVPRAGGYALAAVFHSILNIFFQKDAWLSCPVSQALPHCAHTHTHTHTRTHTWPREQRPGCGVPASSTFTFPQSQPGFRAVLRGWEPASPCHPSRHGQLLHHLLRGFHNARRRNAPGLGHCSSSPLEKLMRSAGPPV